MTSESRRHRASHEIVERCEAFARAQGFTGVRLADLCVVACASERRIRRAFVDVHGVPPTQRLRRMALDEVRELLSSRTATGTSISEVAASRGFENFGRFAATYRHRFGEYPSDTVRNG